MKNSFGPEYASLEDTGFVGLFNTRLALIPWMLKFVIAGLARNYTGHLCSGLLSSISNMLDLPPVWRPWSSIIMNKAGGNGVYLARSAVEAVVPPLRMKGAGCGLPSHHYLILGFPLRCRIRSNQPAIYFMATG